MICGDVSNVLASDLILFPVRDVIRHILGRSTNVVYTCSRSGSVLTIFEFSIMCPVNFDIPVGIKSTCEYDAFKKQWIFDMVGCDGKEIKSVRAIYLATYLSTIMSRYPLAAARICDVSICVLRGVEKLSIMDRDGVPPMFRGCECILGRLCSLRASSAFEELIRDVCDSNELE